VGVCNHFNNEEGYQVQYNTSPVADAANGLAKASLASRAATPSSKLGEASYLWIHVRWATGLGRTG